MTEKKLEKAENAWKKLFNGLKCLKLARHVHNELEFS